MAIQKKIQIKCEYKSLVSSGPNEQNNCREISILRNMYGDPQRFVQIFQNFLSNALKFTSVGGNINVTITILEIQSLMSEEKYESMKSALMNRIVAEVNKEEQLAMLYENDSVLIRSIKDDSLRIIK